MNTAYFDCFSGIAGDMILGALLDLDLPLNTLKKEIAKLNLTGYSFQVERVTRNNISAQNVIITVTKPQPHRTLSDIQQIITSSTLAAPIKKTSLQIFERLAEAEAKIHQTIPNQVHFHEIGAVDSLIDIIGTAIGLHHLKITTIHSSPLPLGTGFVTCAHGILPIPAPATLELVKHIPVYQTNRKQELVTPTGAAIITTLAKTFGTMPPLHINKIGYGAGKTPSEYPNILRILLGTQENLQIQQN
jgi:uncharacterized protein (TIGR00299 family) protein